MIDPAKPSPESGTRVELPAEIEAAMRKWLAAEREYDRRELLYNYDQGTFGGFPRNDCDAARAALIAAIVKYGDELAGQAINGCASRLHEFGWPT